MHLLIAAGAPVIPNFGGASDKCAVNNGFFCWNWFTQHWGSTFGPAVVQHIVLTVIAVGIGFVIAFALALLAYRFGALETPISGISSFLYTIPSLALMGFLLALTGIGKPTAIIALWLYALLPILRNTVTGILAVDPAVREAAVGMGMTGRQILWQVEKALVSAGYRSLVVAAKGSSVSGCLVPTLCTNEEITDEVRIAAHRDHRRALRLRLVVGHRHRPGNAHRGRLAGAQ